MILNVLFSSFLYLLEIARLTVYFANLEHKYFFNYIFYFLRQKKIKKMGKSKRKSQSNMPNISKEQHFRHCLIYLNIAFYQENI